MFELFIVEMVDYFQHEPRPARVSIYPAPPSHSEPERSNTGAFFYGRTKIYSRFIFCFSVETILYPPDQRPYSLMFGRRSVTGGPWVITRGYNQRQFEKSLNNFLAELEKGLSFAVVGGAQLGKLPCCRKGLAPQVSYLFRGYPTTSFIFDNSRDIIGNME